MRPPTTKGILLWSLLLSLVFASDAAGAPPQPDPNPKYCKKKRPCKASIVKRAYTYRIVWRIEDQDGNVTYAPGVCTVPVRGPVTCSITISWG